MSQLAYPTAPGVTVNVLAAVGGSANPAPGATVFIVGITDKGPAAPTQVFDFPDYQVKFGGRSGAAATASDAVELAFAEGAYVVYFTRVLGVTPTFGSHTLMDRAVTPLLTATLSSAWAGALSVNTQISITNGTPTGTFDLNVFDLSSKTPTVAVETWHDNASTAAMVAAVNAGSSYLKAVDNASATNDGTPTGILNAQPALLSPVALSAGSDDRATASDTTWSTAALSFPSNLGPGLLLAPGRYSSSWHLLQEAAAVAQGRMAILDSSPLPAASDLTALALADSVAAGLDSAGDSGVLIGPWVIIPAAPGGSVVRTVPASALLAGLIARGDAKSGHSNRAAMGVNGNARYATGINGPGLDVTSRATANGRPGTTGACVIRSTPDYPCQVYGFRTVSAFSNAYSAANIRQTLAIKNMLYKLGDNYIGESIDGQGFLFNDFANAIGAKLQDLYTIGALYGKTSADAYGVDVGGTVNTAQTIAGGMLRARVWFVPSPTVERVYIDVTRNLVTG